MGTCWVGSDWGFGDGQAGPCMGRCMVMWFWGFINNALYYLGLGGLVIVGPDHV